MPDCGKLEDNDVLFDLCASHRNTDCTCRNSVPEFGGKTIRTGKIEATSVPYSFANQYFPVVQMLDNRKDRNA